MVKGPLLDPLRIPSRVVRSGAPEVAGSIRKTQAASGTANMKVDHPVGVEVGMEEVTMVVVVHLGAARGGAAQTGAVRRRIQKKERTADAPKANETKQA